VVVTADGRVAYTTNTGSDSITGYRIAKDGRLSLLDGTASPAVPATGRRTWR
jgi:6-phosphogluconolactonase (cycloisomerase 2 family)